MKFKLEDICSLRKEKISIEKLTIETYISTENMLPNVWEMAPNIPAKKPRIKKIIKVNRKNIQYSFLLALPLKSAYFFVRISTKYLLNCSMLCTFLHLLYYLFGFRFFDRQI